MRDDQSEIRNRILSQLAEVAVQAHKEGDEHAVNQVVRYLADEPGDLATMFSRALDMAQQDSATPSGAAGRT